MVCYTISCAIPRCLYGEPETLPGHCCPSCPDDSLSMTDKPDLPTISNCPTNVLSVNVAVASESAILTKSITTINAYDSDGNKLKVKYQPKKVYHCQCYDPKPIYVLAYTENDLGGIASCSFNITVKDPYPPRVHNCSKDIYVTEKTTVRWNEPSFEDNVGIGKISRPDIDLSVYKFTFGAHHMTYQVWDFDGNTASCEFSIYVERGLPKMNNCPAEAVRLNTSVYTNVAVVKQRAVGLDAYDFDNNKLLVTYQPQTIEHCKCSDAHKVTFNVSAMAEDDYGQVVSCNFTVTVRDIITPRILFCPSDIYVLEGDVVTWKDAMFVDNVGIAQTFVNMENGTSYPVGRHTVVYVVKDFDGNEAYCRFEIIVDKAKPDPPKIQNCPVNVVQLNTSYMSDYAIVDYFNTGGISAHDDSGNYFEVLQKFV
ncbi:hyalin-like [Ruditapes philippinarum]|uniref:hyalin-like n=1 Tax=Ruditapes philippinarum TaxID=129788 RepID=UPI00295B22BC|nr:hyalin-like [Ruditapes philippinarum]